MTKLVKPASWSACWRVRRSNSARLSADRDWYSPKKRAHVQRGPTAVARGSHTRSGATDIPHTRSGPYSGRSWPRAD
jgi:hypothetical protein